MAETNLVLNGIVFPVGSARGITQTLEPIENGEIRRSINGALVDLTRAAGRKYRAEITFQDHNTPTLAGIWRGSAVTMESAAPLRLPVTGTSVTLTRTPAEGSVVGYTASGQPVAPLTVVGLAATFPASPAVTSVAWRPVLSMMCTGYSTDFDEWQAQAGARVSLEEI